MKILSFKTISKLSGALLLLMLAPTIAKGAFGISPPWIRYDYLKPGLSYSEVITLSTDDASRDRLIKTSITGDPELTKWLRLESQTSLRIPQGKNQLPVTIIIDVPKDAEAKRYSGNISLSLQAAENMNGLDINLGANIKVDVAVSNRDFVDYNVRSINAESIVENNPIFLDLQVENNGNVPLSSIPVELQFWSQNEQTLMGKATASALQQPIPAYGSGVAQIKVEPKGLVPGKYWIRVKALKEGEVLHETKLFLAVDPEESLMASAPTRVQVGDFVGNLLSGSNGGNATVKTSLRVKSPYETPLLVTSLLLAAILVGFGIKKFHHKRHHR